MSTAARSNRYQVTCMGRAFGPEAQAIIQEVAPPELDLFFDQAAGEKGQALAAESDFVLVTAPVTERLLKSSPRLRLVHKWGIGVDKIDLAAAHGLRGGSSLSACPTRTN